MQEQRLRRDRLCIVSLAWKCSTFALLYLASHNTRASIFRIQFMHRALFAIQLLSRNVEPLSAPFDSDQKFNMASSHVKRPSLYTKRCSQTLAMNIYLLSVAFRREPFAMNLLCDRKSHKRMHLATRVPYSRRDFWVYPPRSGKDFF